MEHSHLMLKHWQCIGGIFSFWHGFTYIMSHNIFLQHGILVDIYVSVVATHPLANIYFTQNTNFKKLKWCYEKWLLKASHNSMLHNTNPNHMTIAHVGFMSFASPIA